MIKCNILCDSISPAGHRLTTWELTYPRFLHSEFLTHRMLCKNAASSRAIPIEKMMEAVTVNTACFEQYGKANKGMAAQEEMSDEEEAAFLEDWTGLAAVACEFAEHWKTRAAKQIVNRALEPWMHMTIICTGTDWHNFYALRAHPAAQPEFQVLAYRMLSQYLRATPFETEYSQWHLPLVSEQERIAIYEVGEDARKVSVARCARVSYTRHDQVGDLQKDIELHDRLLSSGHMSPFEHQAMAYANAGGYEGCFQGWKPYRKFLPNENRTSVNLHEILANKPEWVTL